MATVNANSGVATPVGAGPVTIYFTTGSEPLGVGYICGTNGNCPTGDLSAGAGGSVGDPTPVVQSVSPSVWDAGATTTVTITGTGFGTAPQLTLSDTSIGVQIASSGDTQIIANVTVGASAPNENVTVTVTSTGYGNGFQSGGGSQSSHGSNSANESPAMTQIDGGAHHCVFFAGTTEHLSRYWQAVQVRRS